MTNETTVRLIHSLHSALWPTIESEVQIESEIQNNNYLDQTVGALLKHIKCEFDSMSPHMRYVLEKLSIEEILANILNKFQNPLNTKLFLYEFFELILNEME